MNALTRINSDTPVRYDVMNKLAAEVEARDADLQQQINDLFSKCTTSEITLLNGWVLEYGNDKIAKTNSVITFNLNLKSGVTTVGTNICLLPEGYRPNEGLLIDYICYDSNWTVNMGTVWVGTDGNVVIADGNTVYNNRLIINASFIVEG